MKTRDKSFVEKIALERIYRLFELAGKEFSKHPERSKRYVALARRIGKRNRVNLPGEFKIGFCKKCNAFLKKGRNADIGKDRAITVVKCLECGFVRKTGEKARK